MSGYTKLAGFMTGTNHLILRKYEQLAARDLLYLQAEICELEYQFKTIAERDAKEKDNDQQYYDRDWLHLATSKQRDLDGRQWELALAIREKLREYYDAMLQYSQIKSIPQPKPTELDALQKWIKTPSAGGGIGFLSRDLAGIDPPSVYDIAHKKDLAILSNNHGEDDLFTRFVNGPLLSIFHRFWQYGKTSLPLDEERPSKGENRSSLHKYEERHVAAVTNLLGTMFSSIAPLVSIVVLSFVGNPRTRLGLVCAFTLLFTFSLAVATSARRVEIFAATAAFASVQVVFIGTSNSPI